MDAITLEVLWYLVVVAALIFYCILDGFDLGVGALLLFVKKDNERRVLLNSIGPVWDGNEVWLVIVGGALFAGFPDVFATIFSSFYNFVMLLLLGLMLRAVAIEFRSKHESKRWRANWDVIFCVASIIISFGIGLVFGNLIQGIPLSANREFMGHFWVFLKPYPVLLGITTVLLFTMHGAIYLAMKTEGSLHETVRKWATSSIVAFFVAYVVLTIATFVYAPHMTDHMKRMPILFAVPVLAFLSILNVPRLIQKRSDGWAFIFSCISIILLLALFAIGTFPTMVRSTADPQYSLVIANSSSSPLTLKTLLIIVAIGLPLVFAYGFYIYRVFRGKVKLDNHSY